MSDTDRSYSPRPEAPLAFDARRPVSGQAPLPMTLIISGMILLVLIAAVFFVYRGGLSSGGGPRSVGTEVAEVKAPPPPDSQPADPAKGLEIYHAEAGSTAPATPAPTFAPGPEAPAARPLPRAETTSPPVVVEKAKPAEATAPAPTSTVQASALPLKAVAKPVAVKPAAPADPVAAAMAAAEAKPKVVKATAGGGAMVQIGAFSSASAAEKGWSDAARVSPGASLGKGKKVETVAEANGKTLYRTLMTGFASRTEAQSFCASLAAAGKTCLVK